MKDTILVHIGENGDTQYHVVGENVRLLIVDERALSDRSYEILQRSTHRTINTILGNDIIGNSHDGRLTGGH